VLIGESDVFSKDLPVDVERSYFGEEGILGGFEDDVGFGKFSFHGVTARDLENVSLEVVSEMVTLDFM
jgi:hypothetical protein